MKDKIIFRQTELIDRENERKFITPLELEVINEMTEREILFFDPLENEITANNKVYFNAFKLLASVE